MDYVLAGKINAAIVQLYKEENARLWPEAQGQLIAEIYEDIMAAASGPDDYMAALRMAIVKLRKDLRAPPTESSTKRQA